MPLQGQFTWQQKKDLIYILIPLKGVSPTKVDIFVTSSTLKVNFSPYLIDIVINGAVDPLRHKAKVRGGVLKITLFKTDDLSMWDSLEVCDIDKKDSLRLKSSLHQQDIEEKLSESRKDRKVADERHSVRKQMALEEAERNRLEGKKEEEKHIAEEEMYSTFSKLQTPQPHVPRTHVNEPMNDIDEIMGDSHPEVVSRGKRDVDLDDCSDMFDTNPESCDDGDLRYIPPPRSSCVSSSGSSGTVNINFTPRVFPTPMRESTQANEEDWIAKNRKHLKKHGTLGKNIPKGNGVDVTEEDPAWLKAKGDDFFRVGDYLSAMNAYSAALDADDSLIPCYSNRSACYLKLSSPADCKSDCSQAIALLEEVRKGSGKNDSTTRILVKMLMRRGVASCQLGLYKDAISDYQECLRVLQGNPSVNYGISVSGLESDISKLVKLDKADSLKKNADSEFSQSKIAEALELYSNALLLAPLHVGCLSNRAACKIASQDFYGCIDDCSLALDVFDSDEAMSRKKPITSGSSENLSMLTAILPARGSDKRKSWYLKTLVRRGAAYFQAGSLTEAVADYSKACAIDPTNNSLKTDLNNLRNSRSA